MGKVKSTKLNQNGLPSGKGTGDEIKNKCKEEKKLKGIVKKFGVRGAAPKIKDTSELVIKNGGDKIKKTKKKSIKEQPQGNYEKNEGNKEQQEKGAIEGNKPKKKLIKSKKGITHEDKSATNETPLNRDLIETEGKKIEGKKVKKLIQKFKKPQKPLQKSETTDAIGTTPNAVKDKASKDNDSTSIRVLAKKDKWAKKEKRARKRQLLREQRLAELQACGPAIETATVFVGNLPVNTKSLQLIRLFKNYSPIISIRFRSAGGKILRTHKERKSAGTLNAYVVLKDKETAENALSLNGVEFKGNHLRITLASKDYQTFGKEETKRTVFVGNLKYSATEESLREIFSSCGEIDYVRCLRNGDNGCKGVAYVCFKNPDSVGLALELNNTMLDERPIHLERYSEKKLGAKKVRDAQTEEENKSKKNVKQKIDGKKAKLNHKKETKNSKEDGDKKLKKSEFRGVKVEALKKKKILKKKKPNNQMLELAKKIAPKPKTK